MMLTTEQRRALAGSRAMLTATRRASSMVSTFACMASTSYARKVASGGLPRRPCSRASAHRPCRDRHHVHRTLGPLEHFTPQPHRPAVHDIKHDLDAT
jgi:hypothetical protein